MLNMLAQSGVWEMAGGCRQVTTLADANNRSSDEKAKDAVAVALRYEATRDPTPKVVAGGRGRIAEQILEIAFAHGIKVREDGDLAQLLSSIDIDSEIPIEAFAAVAEILTYVYRANGTLGSQSTSDPQLEAQ